jgi:hypothetical protein
VAVQRSARLLAVSGARYDADNWEEKMLKLFDGAGACSLVSICR